MKTESWGIPLTCSIVISVRRSMKRAILALHEMYNILKINGQAVKCEIKVQALKDTSWMKLRYLATLFKLKVSNNHG